MLDFVTGRVENAGLQEPARSVLKVREHRKRNKWAFADRPVTKGDISAHGGVKGTTIKQDVLPDHKFRMLAAHKGTGRTEIKRITETPRGKTCLGLGARLIKADPFILRLVGHQRIDAIRVMLARQQVVHDHTILGHLARGPGNKAGQTGTGTVRKTQMRDSALR